MIRQIYPLITTPSLRECREFYARLFDAQVIFDSEWYLQLAVGHSELGFVHPSAPPELPLYRQSLVSRGLSLVLESTDVAAEFKRLRGLGVETLGRPQRSEWGDFSFRLLDPAGTVINVLEYRTSDEAEIEL